MQSSTAAQRAQNVYDKLVADAFGSPAAPKMVAQQAGVEAILGTLVIDGAEPRRVAPQASPVHDSYATALRELFQRVAAAT